MKYWLKDFEHNISPATWEAADQLCQAGQVRNLREIETHFWVARVDVEEQSFETEVIITPHKIKAYACECFTPGRRLMCVHIAASLLKIRQFLDQRAEERRQKAEAAQHHELSRITINSVLERATPSEVELFVRDYARRDRDFALALKTWFAGSVTESENPYALVLDSVFPKATPAKGFRDPDFRRIRKALDGLEVQLQMAADDGNFRGIFQICTAILQKTLPVLERMEGTRQEALLHFCQLSLQKMAEISDRNLSVELRLAAWQVVFDLGVQGLFPHGLQRQAIGLLSETMQEAEKFEQIRSLFDATPFPSPGFLLELYLTALSVRNMPEAIPMVLEDYLEMPDVVHGALLQLYYLKHWKAVALAGQSFLPRQIFTPKQQRELEDILLYVAEQMGDRKGQLALLRQRFMKSGNFETFRKLKTVAAAKWPALRDDMMDALSARGDLNILAAALAAEEHWEELAALLEKASSIPLLQRYEQVYFERDPEFLQRLYVQLLHQYLQEHFGAPAGAYVRQQLSALIQKGATVLVVNIVKELLRLHPDRPSLPEELSELFATSKRKKFTGV
jgi:hypothetical protein